MATFTTRLGLTKPELIDNFEETDLGSNFDMLDQAVGAELVFDSENYFEQYFEGKRILETGTSNHLILAPSSGAWQKQTIPIVSATGDITAPYTGQLIYNTTDAFIYRYTGSAWVAFASGGDTSKLHEARYYNDAAQSLADATVVTLQFPDIQYSSADVTASGTGNSVFTLNRAGVWRISANVRIVSATGTNGERLISIRELTNASATLASSRDTSQTIPVTLNCSTTKRFAVNSQVDIVAFQQSTAARNTEPVFPKMIHIALTWLRP